MKPGTFTAGRFTAHVVTGSARNLGPELAMFLAHLPRSSRFVAVLPVGHNSVETTQIEVITERVDGVTETDGYVQIVGRGWRVPKE